MNARRRRARRRQRHARVLRARSRALALFKHHADTVLSALPRTKPKWLIGVDMARDADRTVRIIKDRNAPTNQVYVVNFRGLKHSFFSLDEAQEFARQ